MLVVLEEMSSFHFKSESSFIVALPGKKSNFVESDILYRIVLTFRSALYLKFENLTLFTIEDHCVDISSRSKLSFNVSLFGNFAKHPRYKDISPVDELASTFPENRAEKVLAVNFSILSWLSSIDGDEWCY